MFFYFNNENNITSNNSRCFITLSCIYVLIIIRYSWFDRYFYFLFFIDDCLSFASLASILFIIHDTLSSAIRAWLGALRIHAGAEHDHLSHHLLSFTGGTCFGIFSSFTITFGTWSFSANLYLFHASFVGFFEGNLHFNTSSLSFTGSLLSGVTTTSTEKLTKYITHTSSTWGISTQSSFLTIFIVHFSFIGISENFISSIKFLKFFGIASSIRMLVWTIHRCFSKSFFNLVLSCSIFYA